MTGGSPASVQVTPPSVEKPKPERPGVPGRGLTVVKGGRRKPLASFQPATRDCPSSVEAMVVSLRPNNPLGNGCWGLLTRTFGPTRGGRPVPVGLDGPDERESVLLPKRAANEPPPRKSWCASGKTG